MDRTSGKTSSRDEVPALDRNCLMVIEEAAAVIKIEAEGLLQLAERIDENFAAMVDAVYSCSGRVVISGIGKSGIIGRKIVATLNSTGTRSVFLHPVEAMHGDLGLMSADDIFIALSASGETDELNLLVPSIRRIGSKVIAITGDKTSTLAKLCDIVIDVRVEREACPLGLAPTASSTAMLAMGDALAVTLLNRKGFKQSDFKKFHPGGALGRRLASSVADIMLTGDALPSVLTDATMQEALKVMDKMKLGTTLVVDGTGKLAGIITDGDIRRTLVQRGDIWRLKAADVMTRAPKYIVPQAPAYDALALMEKNEITVLPITTAAGIVCGILHLHDILGKGEFRFDPKAMERE
jgi:arabinose-5-phosphate isomerase